MTFNDLIEDICKLQGLYLESIRPGAGLTIQSVDKEHGNLQLLAANRQLKSRPLLELEKIWNALQKSPAVHVDKVLNGSGTSRNQPETILANLPYIEWASIHNKKHLVYVKDNTHAFGTLRKMDDVSAARITSLLDDAKDTEEVSVVVVTPNIKDCIDYFQGLCGGLVKAKELGQYILETDSNKIAFVTPAQAGLDIGTYPVVNANYTVYRNNVVTILGEDLVPAMSNDIRVLIRQK
jgi:hypothetical protein